MLYLNQSRYGYPYGNCFMTCVCCLIEKQTYELPDNIGGDPLLTQKILKEIGYNYLEIDVRENYKIYTLLPKRIILMGKSPRGWFDHAIITDNIFNMIWDPHPSRDGIEDYKCIGIIYKEV